MEEYRTPILTHAADRAGLSRRHFLRVTGLAAGGFGLFGQASAQEATPSAVDVLQFALALEGLEAAFFEGAVTFLQGEPDKAFPRSIAGDAKALLVEIATIVRNHEQTHEQGLAALVTCAGGTPVGRCEYTFAYNDVTGFLQLAKSLEETTVSSYLGSVPLLLGSPALLVEFTKIASMEARHASTFRTLLGEGDPLSGTGALPTCSAAFGSGAFDRLAAFADVKSAVASLIRSDACGPLKP
jgi:hypothetical protein